MSNNSTRNTTVLISKQFLVIIFLFLSYFSFSQPANDNCTNPELITISASGYGTGIFTSSNVNITQATVQTGETFAPAILVAGQSQKSIWFKFTIGTTRKIRVTLQQPGAVIQAGDAGFAVYKTNTCLPGNAALSTQLTPIATFGNTFHPCVSAGDYLVQVSSKSATAGSLSVQIEADFTGAIYDQPATASNFGVMNVPTKYVDFSVECQSLEDGSELCTPVNYQQYTKSTWHTFTTPSYFDWLSVLLASPTGAFTGGQQVIGYRLYKGDARTVSMASLVPVGSCDSFKTTGYVPEYKMYKCGTLDPSSSYSIQLFYKQAFIQDVRLAVAYGGTAATKAPEPILGAMGTNQLGTLPSSATGVSTSAPDYLACNSRHSLHPCGDALPPNGIVYNGITYNLSTFYTFSLSTASNIAVFANSVPCNYSNLLIRLYRQNVTTNCSDLVNANLAGSALNNLNQECLVPGTYTIQVMGQDLPSFNSSNYYYYYNSLASGSQLCMLSNLGQKVDFSIRVTSTTASNLFSLNAPGAFDKINPVGGVPAPLINGQTYLALPDVFGCGPTVLPDTICNFLQNKAMYRQFAIADSGLVTLTNKLQYFSYKLYQGDANALANQQNKHAFPERINGLMSVSECLSYFYNSSDEACRPDKVCVVAGTYTYATFGGSTNYLNVQDKPQIKFDVVLPKHITPVTAQNMGSILDSTIAARTSDKDYFTCTDNAVTINGYVPCTIGGKNATKAIYRQFYLKNEAVVSITGVYDCSYYYGYLNNKTLFSGKASDGLAGLQPLAVPWRCFSSTTSSTCASLPAGWYTVVSYGVGPSYQNPLQNLRLYAYSSMVGFPDQFTITVTPACAGPKYNRPYKASVDPNTSQPYVVNWPARSVTQPSVILSTESINCTVDTPFVTRITSCNPTFNRAAYYVFRVTNATSLQVNLSNSYSLPYSVYKLDVRTDSALFQTAVPIISCANMYSNVPLCNLQPGLYTLVVFASDGQNCSSITPVLSKPCNDPYYNRPYKAAVDPVTNQPFLVDWAPGTGHTAAYPKTDVTYTLPIEYFSCKTDIPFSSHPIVACNASLNRVAYYVFKTVRESYVQVNTKNFYGAVYKLDVRTDSALMPTTVPVQPCLQSNGFIQLCKLPAGTYTLVIFAGDNNGSCSNVTPTIYIDQPGYSRFDRAAKAYDFGNVPATNTWYNGRPGDVNPLDAARAPSNDFIYCTTGSSATDPASSSCTYYNPRVYGDTSLYLFSGANASQAVRRNLWYTFVTNQGGTIKVKVENKTPGVQAYKFRFTVYKSNVDGSLPFATVVSTGQVDSTLAQGLTGIITNLDYTTSYYCYDGLPEVSFSRSPCNNTPERYYILIETTANNNYSYYDPGMQPNKQVEVSVLINPVSATPSLYDHYSQAGNMGTVAAGTFTGPTDNFTCATRDATDPVYDPYTTVNGLASCTKNIWYKFTTSVTGNILFRMAIAGGSSYEDYYNIQLFRQTVAGDSTSVGLKYQQPSSSISDGGFYWSQTCISAGTYYILLPGCSRTNESVAPIIKIIEQAGDFCSAPVVATLTGAGIASATAIVNCHTIGTDYGEFNPQLTCPALTATNTYKSSWFRLDVNGTDTLDVTAFLNENTSATSAQIKYRMMTGNCGAMQEQSCVQDALTQNTYKCLGPGSYYFQVFTPVGATGSIDLKLNAVHHADTCAPYNNCLANANFIPQFDCNTGDSVRFVNYSTYGSAIQYTWSFDYNGQTSAAVSPSFFYPALSISQTYNVTLITRNTSCNGQNTVTVPITIPARPYVNLGRDTSLCNGGPLLLNAISHPGATYQWSTGATTPTITVTTTSTAGTNYWVRVTYNNCTRRDTVKVFINPIVSRNQSKVFCGNDSVLLNSSRGYGESFLWSTGATSSAIYASTAGVYYCTITLNGCAKSDTFNVTSAASFTFGNDTAVCIRPGVPFVLNATTAGAIGYLWQNGSTAATFNVITPGQYSVRINFGTCFARDTINLTQLQAMERNLTASLCAGSSYILPSGTLVSASGIYKDTLRSLTGCDSLITTTNLLLKTVTLQSSNVTVCQGQLYTLPWGITTTLAGNYRDTLRSATDGCDSIIQSVTVSIANRNLVNTSASVCQGQAFTLPSGTQVTQPGIYQDTIRYMNGCDSLVTTLTLSLKTAQVVVTSPSICLGQTYTLPGGIVVNATGTYYDTARYVSGCDSIRYTIHLSIGVIATATINAGICPSVSYTLPSGRVVNSVGVYQDTLRHITGGCDSVHYTVTLTIRPVLAATINASVCSGQAYTLPSGLTVSASGTYRDTLHYTNGCDSLVTTVNLTTKTVANSSSAASVCAGQNFTLPSGAVVNTAGTYRDTLRYTSGCDSVIHTITLQVNVSATRNAVATGCQGQVFILPWGATTTIAGVYRDTLRGATGCDSIIRIVTLTMTPRAAVGISPVSATVCEGDSLRLTAFGGTNYKWIQGGGVLSPASAATWIYPPTAGNYRVVIFDPVCNVSDTIQSLVSIEKAPQISITSSNIVNCIQGSTKLQVVGALRYRWFPVTGLSNPTASSLIAAPAATTVYHVEAISRNNCVAEDSIQVKVIRGDAGLGYQVPNAFTPGTDGKNDCFNIRHWGAVTNLHLNIYDRWGTLIFTTTDVSKCWDGTFKGQPLASAGFVYFISANTVCGPVQRKGTVVLVR